MTMATITMVVVGAAVDARGLLDSCQSRQAAMGRKQKSATGSNDLLGSYRIATAPEPNASLLTSFKSTCFDSPANNVGAWPASLGCTRTRTHRSIPAPSTPARASRLPRTVPYPTPARAATACPRSPCTSSAFQSTRSRVLETTYYFAASIVRAKGSIQGCIQSGLAPVRAGARHAASIIS